MAKQNKITRFARGQGCTARLPGCSPGAENETVVLAHAPSIDKGMAKKSPDWWGAHLCHSCHDALDGRKSAGLMPKEKQSFWLAAVYETQVRLHKAGLLRIIGA